MKATALWIKRFSFKKQQLNTAMNTLSFLLMMDTVGLCLSGQHLSRWRMLSAGMVCVVLVKDISRLGRDYLKIGYYLEQFFPQHSVRFISVSGGIDSNTNSTDFVPLYSVMDEWYARDISRKMRLMYQSRASSGIAIGSPVYGYTKSKEKNELWEIDNE